MSKHKKYQYQRSLNRTIGLAYLARYEPLIILSGGILATLGDQSNRLLLLILGVGLVVVAVHYFLGYVSEWKHIFCMYQDIAHEPMTPDRINWSSLKNSKRKRDSILVPMIFMGLGIVLILAGKLEW